ncbi:tetrapyrrole methylase family protein/MazG family protein [Desulfohalotomaculum tongense]|uniref:nucleoside triphosphate pyrophosphohydrolase n=1 Tax=Desulforadius tongensis TaxID=1216062 RepID=UPI00195B8BFB|nr:nucleoside triphosphate pyrophosphohydrolase [Desulforadius tongensis]MBM7855974.1 tetrapyrrole methylase family protein/MazG family protein [Desulforadius tongensis]
MQNKSIIIAGLGPGAKETLTFGVMEALKKAPRVLLRTKIHPVVSWLDEQGVVYQSFDRYYEECDNFQQLYRRIAAEVLAEAEKQQLLYAVPGHPLVAEETVQLILNGARERGLTVEILPAASFLDAIFSRVGYDPNDGLQVLDGLSLRQRPPVPAMAAVITQVYSRFVAGDVKLTLMEYYDDHHPIKVIRAAGVPGEEKIVEIPLYQLDRLDWIDHLTSVFVPAKSGAVGNNRCNYPLDALVDVMATLRGDNGCPWDKEQTHETLKQYLLEETYEVLEALDSGDAHKICDELGDLLLQVVFHAQIAAEDNRFDINDVINAITEKMVRRHPHVFGDTTVKNSDEVLVNWDKIKAEEQNRRHEPQSLLSGVSAALPALVRAAKLQAKAARVGFDWPDYKGAVKKVKEELEELYTVIETGEREKIRMELGDVLFAVVNMARLLKVDAEGALTGANGKFMRRFQYIEKKAYQRGKELSEMTLEEMDCLWEEAKGLER